MRPEDSLWHFIRWVCVGDKWGWLRALAIVICLLLWLRVVSQ